MTTGNSVNNTITGNAATATILQTARQINGQDFDGHVNISVPVNTTANTASATFYPLFVSSTTNGNQVVYLASTFTINPNTGGFATPAGTVWQSGLNNVNTTQAAFLVHAGSDQTGLAKSSDNTCAFGTEIFDQGNNFASNTFTAPVTGRYQLSVTIGQLSNFNSATRFYCKIVTSNRSYGIININPTAVYVTSDLGVTAGTILADMDAGDTAVIVTYVSGGASTYSLLFNGECPYFSGVLVC